MPLSLYGLGIMILTDPRNSSVRRNTGTGITIPHAVVTVRITTMKQMTTVLLVMTAMVRGGAATHVMTAVSHILQVLVSVVVTEVCLMRGLPQGVIT